MLDQGLLVSEVLDHLLVRGMVAAVVVLILDLMKEKVEDRVVHTLGVVMVLLTQVIALQPLLEEATLEVVEEEVTVLDNVEDLASLL